MQECGTACPDSCQTMAIMGGVDREDESPMCVGLCVSGCQCDAGYMRSSDNTCVTMEQCAVEIQCPMNEVFDTCGIGCITTCENRHDPVMNASNI